MRKQRKYMNPYLAGVLLGLALLSAIYFSGRGLGASGGIKYCVASVIGAFNHNAPGGTGYFAQYFEGGARPLQNWLVYEILGLLIGGFLSGLYSGRLKLRVEKPTHVSTTRRLLFAFLGGTFFVFGAQLARGCTSGAALSGMAVLSTAGFVTMLAIFGSAYAFAWFFRKNWI
ncbi:MAG: YeeE/YedE family protein [Bacteroidales bacterium]|nr:YeeE/YedE family protein [Bacteroidales bacterium]